MAQTISKIPRANDIVRGGNYNVNTLTMMLVQELVESNYFEYSQIDESAQIKTESVLLLRNNGGKVPESMDWVNYVTTIEVVFARTLDDKATYDDTHPAFLIHTNIPFYPEIKIFAAETWSARVPNLMNIIKTDYMDDIVNHYKKIIEDLESRDSNFENFTSYLANHKNFKMLGKDQFSIVFEEIKTNTNIEVVKYMTISGNRFQVIIESNNVKMMKVYENKNKETCKDTLTDVYMYIDYLYTHK